MTSRRWFCPMGRRSLHMYMYMVLYVWMFAATTTAKSITQNREYIKSKLVVPHIKLHFTAYIKMVSKLFKRASHLANEEF